MKITFLCRVFNYSDRELSYVLNLYDKIKSIVNFHFLLDGVDVNLPGVDENDVFKSEKNVGRLTILLDHIKAGNVSTKYFKIFDIDDYISIDKLKKFSPSNNDNYIYQFNDSIYEGERIKNQNEVEKIFSNKINLTNKEDRNTYSTHTTIYPTKLIQNDITYIDNVRVNFSEDNILGMIAIANGGIVNKVKENFYLYHSNLGCTRLENFEEEVFENYNTFKIITNYSKKNIVNIDEYLRRIRNVYKYKRIDFEEQFKCKISDDSEKYIKEVLDSQYFNNNYISIMYSLDHNRINDLLYSLISLKSTVKNNDFMFIYIVYDSLNKLHFDRIKKVRIKNSRITFISVDEIKELNLLKPLDKIGWDLPVSAYSYLFSMKFVNSSKLIYLDTDTIINKDINKLWSINLNDKTIGGVIERIDFQSDKFLSFSIGSISKLGWDLERAISSIDFTFDEYKSYINSGVLLINTFKFINKQDFFIDFHNNHLERYYNDQDVINNVFKNDIKYLSNEFNYFPFTKDSNYGVRQSDKLFKKIAKKSNIIHLGGTMKLKFTTNFLRSNCPIKMKGLKIMIWEKLM